MKLPTMKKEKTETAEGGRARRGGLKKLLIGAVAAAVVIGGGLALWNRMPKGQSETIQSAYQTQPVVRRTIIQQITGSGSLTPLDAYNVTTLAAGEILSDEFEEGDVVEKGQLLYQLDSSAAQNNLEKSRILLAQAQRAYQEAAEHKYIRAEAAGQVYALSVHAGDKVNAGQQVAVLRDSSVMLLRVPFPAADTLRFVVGQSAQVTLDSTFEVLPGTVREVSGSDQIGVGGIATRTVTIAVPNPGALTEAHSATAVIDGVGCTEGATLKYQAELTLVAQSTGTVASIPVREGQLVEENAIIIVLSGDSLNQLVESAEEALRSAELSLEDAEDRLNSCMVESPIEGTVVEKKLKAGDKAEAGKLLCTIYDMSSVMVNINIDELDVNKVQVGQKVRVTADAITNEEYEGVVTRISVAGSANNGVTAYPATVRIDEIGSLLPGMNVNADIVVTEAEDVLTVPAAAVVRGGMVLVTEDSPSAVNAVQEQEAPAGFVYVWVETGASDNFDVEIVSGLQEGDVVGYQDYGFGMGYVVGYGGEEAWAY